MTTKCKQTLLKARKWNKKIFSILLFLFFFFFSSLLCSLHFLPPDPHRPNTPTHPQRTNKHQHPHASNLHTKHFPPISPLQTTTTTTKQEFLIFFCSRLPHSFNYSDHNPLKNVKAPRVVSSPPHEMLVILEIIANTTYMFKPKPFFVFHFIDPTLVIALLAKQ